MACNPELSAWERMTRDALLYQAKRRQEVLSAEEAMRATRQEDPGTEKPAAAPAVD